MTINLGGGLVKYSKQFTLIEVIISISILAIVVTGTINSMGQIQTGVIASFDRIYARQLLNEVTSKYENIDYDTLVDKIRRDGLDGGSSIDLTITNNNDASLDDFINDRNTFQVTADVAGFRNFTPHIMNDRFYEIDVDLAYNDEATDETEFVTRVEISIKWKGNRTNVANWQVGDPEVFRTIYRTAGD